MICVQIACCDAYSAAYCSILTLPNLHIVRVGVQTPKGV